MKCPLCHQMETKVSDSRVLTDTGAVRRRRECLQCGHRFTTFENVDISIQVRKRDGRFEDFQKEKLIKGLDAACSHSRISHDQVRALVSQISNGLIQQQKREISSAELGEIVMGHLQKLDVIAYIRFACVYKRFTDVEELMEAIQAIIPKDKGTSDQVFCSAVPKRTEEETHGFKKE